MRENIEYFLTRMTLFMKENEKMYFLVQVSFDGRKLHGVQEVAGFNTLSSVIRVAFNQKFPLSEVSIMRSSRLDKGVSARELYLQLIVNNDSFAYSSIEIENWLIAFTASEHSIKFLSVVKTQKFHLLALTKQKTYRYFFTDQYTTDPFVVFVKEILNQDLIDWAIQEFIGEHHFKSFSIRGKSEERDLRKIIHAELLTGDFDLSPLSDQLLRNVWCFEVTGVGFMRGQVRMMMGALLKLCSGQITKDDFQNALKGNNPVNQKVGFKVPAEGLILWETILEEVEN